MRLMKCYHLMVADVHHNWPEERWTLVGGSVPMERCSDGWLSEVEIAVNLAKWGLPQPSQWVRLMGTHGLWHVTLHSNRSTTDSFSLSYKLRRTR